MIHTKSFRQRFLWACSKYFLQLNYLSPIDLLLNWHNHFIAKYYSNYDNLKISSFYCAGTFGRGSHNLLIVSCFAISCRMFLFSPYHLVFSRNQNKSDSSLQKKKIMFYTTNTKWVSEVGMHCMALRTIWI